MALVETSGRSICFIRRIRAHQVSNPVPCPPHIAHPSSSPAQSLLGICSGLLTFDQPSPHVRVKLRRGMLEIASTLVE